MPIKFLANKNTIIFGQTGSGKTHFMLELIRKKMIHPFPKNIYYMYKVEQDFMKSWNKIEEQKITFIQSLNPDKMKTSEPSLLVIDDLLLSTNKDVVEMFILGSHHKQISLFYLSQNLFPDCSLFRTMSNNAHYFVIFNNKRNSTQIHRIAHQVYMGKDVQRIKNAYKRIQQQHWGFMVLTFVPELPEELTVVTDWWESCPSVYLQNLEI